MNLLKTEQKWHLVEQYGRVLEIRGCMRYCSPRPFLLRLIADMTSGNSVRHRLMRVQIFLLKVL